MKFRIVLVDDNVFFRQSLHDILHDRFPEIDLYLATNNEECLTLLKDFSPDILFLDLQFHDLDALKLVQRIRRHHPSIVIVILTEYDMNEYRSATLLAGGNYVIPKTLCTGNEILALVRTILANLGFSRSEDEPWPVGDGRHRMRLQRDDHAIERLHGVRVVGPQRRVSKLLQLGLHT